MCGIAGIVLPDGAQVNETDLRRIAATMDHRGPDASGVWASGGIGFAHTRLSLFDLSEAANQPWASDVAALVFNGEIYNFKALRTELQAKGVAFTTLSDTEVLFAALGTYGVVEALSRIEGMFAFAYHDLTSGTTYLCRDRYGIKPLLYMNHRSGIAFSSEVKALLPVAEIEVDETLSLLALRTLGDKFQTRTLFKGVQLVAPGSVVTVREGRVISAEHYAPILDLIDENRYRELDSSTFEDVCNELHELLYGAVDRMAACDAKLGAFLSGGVDSSLLTAISARQGHDHFRTFTSDVVGPGSELAPARAVADSLGVPLSRSVFEPEDWIRDWVRCTWYLETPIITHPSALPFAKVAALAHAEGYKAVLTGEGSDELFLGYPRLASRALERVAGAPVNLIRKLYRRVPGLADAILNERDERSNDFLRGIVGGFEEKQIATAAAERYGFLEPAMAELHANTPRMVQSSLQSLLQRNDRMGMSASIESRFPFLDEHVMAFALNLPARHKLRRSVAVHDLKHPFVVDKAPIRAVADRYLSTDHSARPKNGFPITGLRGVRVRSGAFKDSWASAAFGGGSSFDREISEWNQPYDVAKLASVEIFGRLFGEREPLGKVEEWVSRNVEISP